ncbi:MAG: type II toxin-antitoxin system prevent-host-death family antitoxin [Acidobacteria bacterium]|nr:type II toxin-antitoxin system prevent-host-death family antitoxin [Acidobacteriota bacterium]
MSVKKANIGELKTHLSVYLKGVKNGGMVLVTERNRPVAKIVPLDEDDLYETEEEQLIAEGILSPPKSSEPLPDDFFDDLPYIRGNRAIEVLLEERYGD